ncbi:MAG: class I SAM-dependent methyltransferase [Kiritimatiellia bacterium]|jgi:predicted O-methyltransferase YrrM|nr:class I SAM-dependent methyltransferase [Kiritimatiellia bacterium]
MNDLPLFIRRYIQSLAGCMYFFAGGFLRQRHRALLYTLCTHFGFEKELDDPNAKPAPTVPSIPASQIINDATTVHLSRIADVAGNITPTELMIIAAFVKQRQSAICFEIGTFDGRTTQNIAANQPPGGQCFTLDLPQEGAESAALPLASGDKTYINKPASGARIAKHDHPSQITQLYGDSATFDFAPWHNKVDLMFVDGSHSYEYVLSDTEAAWKMVKPGGLILWHDYDSRWWPGVTRALNQLQSADPRFAEIRNIENTALCFLVR